LSLREACEDVVENIRNFAKDYGMEQGKRHFVPIQKGALALIAYTTPLKNVSF